jgi:UDP-glucose 4-epimerase
MSVKNILITGATGFVGRYFVNKYSKKYNIQSFSFLRDDLSKLNLSSNKIETVIHLAALVHQMNGADKEEYFKINQQFTLDLAKKAKAQGVKHFIFMSTVKVYGEESEKPYLEDSPCKPQDNYGRSKLAAEKDLQDLEDENFIVSIIRTPIIYGYNVKGNIKTLISIVNKVPVLPFYNTNNLRSMVYIGNLCHMIDILVKKRISGKFLASDDETISTSEFIKKISKALNKKVYLIYIPFFKQLLRIVKPSFYNRLYESLYVENTTTQEILKLENLYTLDEGINLMVRKENNKI